MKLIPLIIFIISLAVDLRAQNFKHEQFPFPPQFQTPRPSLFPTDSPPYLPLESHTAIPYFPTKHVNNLQFPYLPPTGTKAPITYPTPYPMIMSSSSIPNFDDDDNEHNGSIRIPMKQSPEPQKLNHTERRSDVSDIIKEKREMRGYPNNVFHQPIDRTDLKLPNKFPALGVTTSNPMSQTLATKRMIISADTHRNDIGLDQIKAASFQGNQYLAAPGVFISSTTEPAIPILRLSNEMDLDGSFSYEALGADQTHYVQHSRMENMGTDKEEQVVEGSYSYIGDNGQTYTVHYIADSNGFRASGDHLPVAPPIPEIIQRSIQYNLAEEAKRPPHLKSWQEDEKDNQINESDKNHRYIAQPPRNLFTGRTPEAFSYSYSQGSNTQNNLVTAASSQIPIQTIDITSEQPKAKPNNSPISPQITFLASQGAHLPSMNTVQNSISRMFSTEKSTMPQLVNYEAALKDSQEQENKALWRWQYGLQANNLNQNSNKDTISRSFGEGDDVMINFNEMTPEQYTKMIESQFDSNLGNSDHYTQNHQFNEKFNNDYEPYYANSNSVREEYLNENNIKHEQPIALTNGQQEQILSTEETITSRAKPYNENYNLQFSTTPNPTNIEVVSDIKQKLITHNSFTLPTHTVTQSYDFDENFEPRKIKTVNTDNSIKSTNYGNEISKNNDKHILPHNFWTKTIENNVGVSTTQEPAYSTVNNFKFTDFIVHDDESKSDFKPLLKSTTQANVEIETTTTDANMEDIFKNNLFLKNFFNTEKTNQKSENKISEEPKKILHSKIEAEPKTDKIPKFIQYHSKPVNDIKINKKKPLDIADILNYVSMKNHFESNKIKNKNKQMISHNYDHKNNVRFIPVQQDNIEENKLTTPEPNTNNFRNLNHDQQEELRGIIKNYKVLHRNNSNMNSKYDVNQLKRELSPPPLKQNLPPLGRAGPSMKSYLPPIYI